VEFDSAVLGAANPPAGCDELWGGELSNGRPHCEHVAYKVPRGEVLLYIRTVFAEPVPPPVIRTVEDVYSVLMNFRLRIHRRPPQPGVRRPPTTREEGRELTSTGHRDVAAAPAREIVVALDDGELRGSRRDFTDCSVAEFDWIDGARVFCAGRAEILDGLRLSTRAGS
jgi:hypothetical protein